MNAIETLSRAEAVIDLLRVNLAGDFCAALPVECRQTLIEARQDSGVAACELVAHLIRDARREVVERLPKRPRAPSRKSPRLNLPPRPAREEESAQEGKRRGFGIESRSVKPHVRLQNPLVEMLEPSCGMKVAKNGILALEESWGLSYVRALRTGLFRPCPRWRQVVSMAPGATQTRRMGSMGRLWGGRPSRIETMAFALVPVQRTLLKCRR